MQEKRVPTSCSQPCLTQMFHRTGASISKSGLVITVQGCAPCHQHTAVSLVNNSCQQQPREAGSKLSLSCSNSTSTKKDKNSNRNDHVGAFIVRIGFLNL